MRSLLRFILRYHATFLFVILEVICVVMIVVNNHYQRTVFSNSAELFVGKLQKNWSGVTSYFSLARENKLLADENRRLKNELEQRSAYSRFFEVDSSNVNYYYYKADVINNSIWNQKNFITIDAGIAQGISKDMGVTGSLGVVGIVYNCSANYATVIPIINTGFKLSVKISRNDYFGSLSWSGSDYRFARMAEVPVHVEVKVGDTIVTSGFSAIFPPDIPVGIVDGFQKISSSGLYEINVKLFTDFASLKHVYVVENRNKNEIQELEAGNDQ
ncbi:MAG: rod shape-determining protein MreC [Bacteroidales bacterium]|nr:rod shape-determining protein MreC [Bacteroidales bacterium]